MREVVKWSKNYKTGQLVTESVMKPNNLIGRATIEVMDSNGELSQKCVSENIITPLGGVVGNAYYESQFQSLMTGTYWATGAYGTNDNETISGFGVMLLSTDDSVESEDNLFRLGDVVGWCPRTNTNAENDVTRGVYNPTESYSRIEDGYYHCHLVYDFGTSQGNGEFSSVWWIPEPYYTVKDSVKTPFRICKYKLPFRKKYVGISGNQYSRNGKGQLCEVKSGNYYPILNTKMAINGIEDIKLAEQPSQYGANRSNIWSFSNGTKTVKCESVGFSNRTVSKDDLKRCTLKLTIQDCDSEQSTVKELVVWSELSEISRAFEAQFNQGLTWAYMTNTFHWVDDEGVLWGVLECSSKNNSEKYYTFPTLNSKNEVEVESWYETKYLYGYDLVHSVWKLKPSATKESLYIPTKISSYIVSSLTDKKKVWGDTYLLLQGTNKVIEWNNKTHVCKLWYSDDYFYLGSSQSSSRANALYCFGPYDTIISGTNEDCGCMLVRAYNAHTKLPNKVTKTSADTMKVQYDYYIQIPLTFTDDGNYIPSHE